MCASTSREVAADHLLAAKAHPFGERLPWYQGEEMSLGDLVDGSCDKHTACRVVRRAVVAGAACRVVVAVVAAAACVPNHNELLLGRIHDQDGRRPRLWVLLVGRAG